MRLRWLHLSDIHFAYTDYSTERMRETLFQKLKELNQIDPFDCIFITGDVTDKNKGYSDELNLFIGRLLDTVQLSEEALFIVPGNHDINRGLLSSEEQERLQKFNFNDSKMITPSDITNYTKAQTAFYEWYKTLKNESFPLEDVHYVTKYKGFNIVHLNTCWQCGSDIEEGCLYLSVNSLHQVLKSANLKKEDLNIALGHHNLEWLCPHEREEVRSLFNDYGIDFYLSGHTHNSYVVYDHHIDVCFCTCRQGKTNDSVEGGFVIGNIDTDNNNHYLSFHTWKSSGSYWSIDNEVGLNAPTGTYFINTRKYSYKSNADTPIVIAHKSMGPPINKLRLLRELGLDMNSAYYQYPYSDLKNLNPEEWLEHKDNTEMFVRGTMTHLQDKVAHIIPLSPIPLLIQMGYLYQDSNSMNIYQLDEGQTWVSSGKGEQIDLYHEFRVNNSETKKLIIAVEVSSYINTHDIDQHVSTDSNSFLRFWICEPERYKVLYENQIKPIKQSFRRICERYVTNYDEVHLFCAVPAGLAVEIGRSILMSLWPPIYLYNYSFSGSPRYQLAFTINQ